uniref:hypothetical protein n=1 Tax=Aliarcobacter sp. TaxID=2321116 RepID=UPI004047B8EC
MTKTENGATGLPVVGNTKQRVSPSIHWVFTLNNYEKEELDYLIEFMGNGSIEKYMMQEEIGENGTPHIQGYISFKKKCRPLETIKLKRIHWEKCNNIEASINYCRKEESRNGKQWTNIKEKKELKILKPKDLYKWQLDILDIVNKEPDDRTIYWIWEDVGGAGKTQFCKYLIHHHKAALIAGKSNDCKHGIICYEQLNKEYPELVIYDVPRCNMDYVSYDTLECIKNGLFFSGKYETAQVMFNSPHVFVFSNEPPNLGKMSMDRWVIIDIGINQAPAPNSEGGLDLILTD